MTKVDHHGIHSQVFRDFTTSRVVPIPTRLDKSGQRIVLWKDILRVFEDAKYLLNNGEAVLFLTDDEFEDVLPLRISHHPGVVLDVVVASAIQAATVVQSVSSLPPLVCILNPIPESLNGALEVMPPSCVDTAEIDSVSDQIVDVVVTTVELTENTLVLHSNNMSTEAEISLDEYSQLCGSYFQALISGQEIQSTSIKEAMKTHFGSIQAEMDKNKVLQDQLLQMQEDMLDKQQKVLDRLAIIQSRIQAVITQTYELHEYPIPRLFIVLPKAAGRREKIGNLFSNQFRLFFLCECGAHTKTERSRIPHEIHLAKHEGYDLDRPTEFFEKYGSYVLTMMQMLKYGFAAAGIIVPPLASFKLVEGIEAVQESLDLAKSSIGPLVDETISFIQAQKSNTEDGIEIAAEQAELKKLEVLEGADLRQLESYLRIRDKGRALGNLYRMVTQEGNVKWVCIDHYRENYRESATQQLKDVVEANGGGFIEEEGKIDIRIASTALAKQFYDALAKARGTQELHIVLQWDATLDDLRKFAAAVTKANILHLAMDGVYFKGPALDAINRGRRFDPIIQLMSNGRIQSLNLVNFKDFYQRVSSLPTMAAHRLRILSIDANLSAVEQSLSSTQTKILRNCPALTDLSIEADNFAGAFQDLTGTDSSLPNLRSLTIRWLGSVAAMALHQGRVRSMELEISFSSPGVEGVWKLLERGYLTGLRIQETPQEADETRLESILRKNPKLSELEIVCHSKRTLPIIKLITSTRENILSDGGSLGLCRFELLGDAQYFDAKHSGSDDIVRTTVDYLDSGASLSMSTSIKMQSMGMRDKTESLTDLFRERGWSICQLDADWAFNDHLAMLMDNATKGRHSKLTSLVLDPRSLTPVGLECMDRIIGRSQSLKYFGLHMYLDLLKDKLRQDKLKWLISRHGMRLNSLTLDSETGNVRAPQLARIFPGRHAFPELEMFQLSKYNLATRTPSFLQWIVAMVSDPRKQSVLTPSETFQSSVQDSSPGTSSKVGAESSASSTNDRACKSLRSVVIDHTSLESEDWRVVIEALDFSSLEVLSFEGSNFSLEQFIVLVDSIAAGRDDMPLRVLTLTDLHLAVSVDISSVKDLCARIEKKVPLTKIEGLW